MADRDKERGGADSSPEAPIVDVQDWPPMSRTDAARAELDREVGTLGIGAEDDQEAGAEEAPEDEAPEAWAAGTPTADEELGTGVMGRGEDLLTKGETHGLAADPGPPIEEG